MIITQDILPSPGLSHPRVLLALNCRLSLVVSFRKYQNATSIIIIICHYKPLWVFGWCRQQLGWTLPDTVNTVKCFWWWAKTSPETCRADLE